MSDSLNPGAKKLKRYMVSHDLNQEQLAARIQVPGPQISLWSNGRRRPSIAMALLLEEETGGFITVRDWAAPRKPRKPKPAP